MPSPLMIRRLLWVLPCLSLLLYSSPDAEAIALPRGEDSTYTAPPSYHRLSQSLLREGIPLMSMGVGYNLYNSLVRDVRQSYTPWFKHSYDDYCQFIPLATQLGLRLASVEGSSSSWGRMLTSDALATVTMLGVVTATKTLTRVRRPDGSSANSFPSGHTAMAFTAATLLHLEYGERYPWLSALAYTASTATGVGRILNNRHWIGDVVTGAGVGIVSAHLGYWLSDLIFGVNSSSARTTTELLLGNNLEVDLPVQYGLHTVHSPQLSDNHLLSTSVGLGIQYYLGKQRYLTRLELRAQSHKLEHSADKLRLGTGSSLDADLMLGKEFRLYRELISTSLMVGVEMRLPRGQSSRYGQVHYSPRIQLSPKIRFSEHLALRLNLAYISNPDYITLHDALGRWEVKTSLPHWVVGSAIVLSL